MMKSLFLVFCLAAALFAGNLAGELFDQGNLLYEKGSYDSSITVYQKILSMGYHDARVYYNLGNAHFRKKEIGPAVLNFEKARLLDPSDKDIQNNLLFARASTMDKIAPPEEGFFQKIILKLHNALGIPAQTILVLVLLYALSLCVILFFVASPGLRELLKSLALVILVIGIPLAVSLSIKVSQEGGLGEAIVLSNQLNAVNEPEGSQVMFAAHEGTKFRLHRKVGSWYFASLENNMSGWIPETNLGLVELSE